MIDEKYTPIKKYIDKLHLLTIKGKDAFLDIQSYENRKTFFITKYIETSKKIREIFFKNAKENPELWDLMREYIKEKRDYIVYVNLLVSSTDQKKYKGNEIFPFVAYWYQVLVWELSSKASIALLKPRDMGISFGIYSGLAMNLSFGIPEEIFVLSESEKKVDSIGDRTQTTLGRTRQILESSRVVNMKVFKKQGRDKFLELYYNDWCGVLGSALTATAGNQLRFRKAIIDEAGLMRRLLELDNEIKESADFVIAMGTLKPGLDDGLRSYLNSSHTINHYLLWDIFVEKLEETQDYRESIDFAIDEILKDIPIGTGIRIKLRYTDHPLKAGKSDFEAITRRRLRNDPTAIAHQLLADENAPNPDRSLYGLEEIHFIYDRDWKDLESMKIFETMKLYAGFDPGGHGNAALVPFFSDGTFYYFFPEERFQNGIPEVWLQQIINKFCKKYSKKMTIFADQAINQYKEEGWLWNSFIYKGDFKNWLEVIPVNNGDISAKLLVSNTALQKRVERHPIFEGIELPVVFLHEKNKEWAMKFIAKGKYTDDKEQKRISHPSEAFIYALSSIFEDDFVDNRILLG